MNKLAIGLSSSLLMTCCSAESPAPPGQELQIDFSTGREVVSDWQYGFREIAAVDHDRGLLYVVDASEPLAAMAFSLEDGTLMGTYGGQEGDGPGELRSLEALAAASDGVLVGGGGHVNHWASVGELAGVWRPDAPGTPSVCSWRDAAAVPLPGGVLRQDADGSGRVAGDGRTGKTIVAKDMEESLTASSLFGTSKLVCIDDVAYILDERLTGHSLDGQTFEVPIPFALEESSRRRRESTRVSVPGSTRDYRVFVHPYSGLFHDGEGNLVVTLQGSRIAGAVIDPVTRCQSILLDTEPGRSSRRVMGMYRDSVLAAENAVTEQTINGVATRVVDPGAHVIALRPLRHMSGEPCPGRSAP